jgi:hypothetical protein
VGKASKGQRDKWVRFQRSKRVNEAVVSTSEEVAGRFLSDWRRRHRKALAKVRRMVDRFAGGSIGYAPRAHHRFRVLCTQLRSLALTLRDPTDGLWSRCPAGPQGRG